MVSVIRFFHSIFALAILLGLMVTAMAEIVPHWQSIASESPIEHEQLEVCPDTSCPSSMESSDAPDHPSEPHHHHCSVCCHIHCMPVGLVDADAGKDATPDVIYLSRNRERQNPPEEPVYLKEKPPLI